MVTLSAGRPRNVLNAFVSAGLSRCTLAFCFCLPLPLPSTGVRQDFPPALSGLFFSCSLRPAVSSPQPPAGPAPLLSSVSQALPAACRPTQAADHGWCLALVLAGRWVWSEQNDGLGYETGRSLLTWEPESHLSPLKPAHSHAKPTGRSPVQRVGFNVFLTTGK